ncbi:acyl-CoA dehydrogenase family protein [Streptosporangium sp. DT93]|uniref:acyl-CoA dehydrogenase family protein n=1 Tax=Streptosporangium sp. DT93 TaxID=3393428 RepID=UPI003CF75327
MLRDVVPGKDAVRGDVPPGNAVPEDTGRGNAPPGDTGRGNVPPGDVGPGDTASPGATAGVGGEHREAALERIAALAAEAEELRRLPDELVGLLRAHGYLRMTLPRRHGGEERDLPGLMADLRVLAGYDASVAWTVMVWAQSQITMARLPPEAFESVLAGGPDVIVSASSAGEGEIAAGAGGVHVRGRWGFASGVHHCRWILVHCRPPGGDPRGVLLPMGEVEIEETWRVLGLRATGSDTVRARGITVPGHHLYDLRGTPPALSPGPPRGTRRGTPSHAATPHSLLPVRPAFALHMGAVALGTAEGALRDLLDHVRERGAAGERAEHRLGLIRVRLDAAVAQLEAVAAVAWRLAAGGAPFPAGTAAAMAASAAHAVRTATEVTGTSFAHLGSRALFDSSVTQRRLRDVLTIAQHANVSADALGALGGTLLRERP